MCKAKAASDVNSERRCCCFHTEGIWHCNTTPAPQSTKNTFNVPNPTTRYAPAPDKTMELACEDPEPTVSSFSRSRNFLNCKTRYLQLDFPNLNQNRGHKKTTAISKHAPQNTEHAPVSISTTCKLPSAPASLIATP